MGLEIRAYARSRGVHHRAIQYAIEQGIIVRQADGSIDPDQADASWGWRHEHTLATRYTGPVEFSPEIHAALVAEDFGEVARLLEAKRAADPDALDVEQLLRELTGRPAS